MSLLYVVKQKKMMMMMKMIVFSCKSVSVCLCVCVCNTVETRNKYKICLLVLPLSVKMWWILWWVDREIRRWVVLCMRCVVDISYYIGVTLSLSFATHTQSGWQWSNYINDEGELGWPRFALFPKTRQKTKVTVKPHKKHKNVLSLRKILMTCPEIHFHSTLRPSSV